MGWRGQNAIMSTDIPSYLMRYVQPQFSAEVRVAALWCVINLCWQEGDRAENQDRLLALRNRGLEVQLRAIRDDASMEIKHRVSTALTLFGKLGPHTDATTAATEGDDPADTLMSDS